MLHSAACAATAGPPDRFIATDGEYAGTTFVFPDRYTVITYQTDSPDCYFVTISGATQPPARHDMTPDALAWLEAVPLSTARSAAARAAAGRG